MVITRTPFRISFFGGGTDYPAWYREEGGAVLSTTINKYCYITTRYLPPFFPYKHRIRYTKREETQSVEEIKHPSVRECLKFMGVTKGIEMVHHSDLPAMAGLGSSSAFTVGFLNSLYALSGKMTNKRKLALDAIHIEQNLIKEAVGSQDQTAAAFGGLNKIEFGGNEEVRVYPITIGKEQIQKLENHCMLFFTGFTREAAGIAKEKIKNVDKRKKELSRMKEMVEEGVRMLEGGRMEEFGGLLHEGWMLKRTLAEVVSNERIDSIYERGRKAGARGGKLLGAGGGGFMLFFASPENHEKIRKELADLLYVPFRFDTTGSQIIYYAPNTEHYEE